MLQALSSCRHLTDYAYNALTGGGERLGGSKHHKHEGVRYYFDGLQYADHGWMAGLYDSRPVFSSFDLVDCIALRNRMCVESGYEERRQKTV